MMDKQTLATLEAQRDSSKKHMDSLKAVIESKLRVYNTDFLAVSDLARQAQHHYSVYLTLYNLLEHQHRIAAYLEMGDTAPPQREN